MDIIKILVFCVPLLWVDTFPSNTFAKNNTDDPDSFLKDFVQLNKIARWGPLRDRKQEMGKNITEIGLKDIQALSYLQGYAPASLLKNVTIYDKHKAFPGYNLFLSANAPGAALMDMDGTIVHQWRFPYASLPLRQGYYDPDWCRVRIFKNGAILALVPFGGLLKIDKDSRLIWFRKITCHHDFDIDGNGNIYTLTVKNSSSGGSARILVDSITVLSPDGEIRKNISLYGLFKNYPDHAYINEINQINNAGKIYSPVPGDAFHSNAIQVLDGKWSSKIPAFKKGNLLVSIRELGVIICVDPGKEEINWLMDTVFWNRGQHFAKLLDNGNILIFDNLYRSGLSRVVEFDPAARKIVWDYPGPKGRFYSSYLGECYRLPNGNTLITESTNGHCIEVTPDKKIVWEFYNPNQVDNNGKLPDSAHQTQRFPDKYKKLIAVIYQMQRIPIDSNSDLLKN